MWILGRPVYIASMQASRLDDIRLLAWKMWLTEPNNHMLWNSYRPCPKHSSKASQGEPNANTSKQIDESTQKAIHGDDAEQSPGPAQKRTNIAYSQRSVENVRKDIGGYAVHRASNFIHKFESKLEQRFPRAIKISRQFTNGFRTFLRDFVKFTHIYKSIHINGMNLDQFKRKDLEVYYSTPYEARKLVPFFCVAALPFAQYIILPIA